MGRAFGAWLPSPYFWFSREGPHVLDRTSSPELTDAPNVRVRALPFGFRMSITQVLRDGHKELPSGCLSGEERSAMCDKRRSEVQQFMQTKAEASQVEASGNPKTEAELVRLANTHYLCALDNAMCGGIGQGMARFCCLRRPVALGPHQRRYFISSEEAGMAPLYHRRLHRQAVVGMPGGPVAFRRARPPKVGLGGRPGACRIPCGALLARANASAGGRLLDPWHLIAGDIGNAINMTGEWAIVLEYLIVLNLPIEPWDGQAYCWKIYHRRAPCSSPSTALASCSRTCMAGFAASLTLRATWTSA